MSSSAARPLAPAGPPARKPVCASSARPDPPPGGRAVRATAWARPVRTKQLDFHCWVFLVCFLFSQKNARWKYSLLGSEVCCSQVSHTMPVLQDVSSAAGMSCKAAAGSSPGCCAPCAAWLTGWMCWSVSGCSGAACLSAGFLLSYISSNCQQSWLQGQASAQLLHLPSNCKRGHGPKDTQISAWGELICADGHSARIQALDLV